MENQNKAEPQAKAVHTPGPWNISHRTNLDERIHPFPCIEGPNGHLLAETCGSGKKAEANARLIAAAPELLAALKAYRAWHTQPSGSLSTANNLSEAGEAARAAIAKAEGRS